MATIKIDGMSCQHCVMSVTRALQKIEGVQNVQVSLDKGEATFEETHPVDMDAVRGAVTKAGFHVA